jgi:hypothetical protein
MKRSRTAAAVSQRKAEIVVPIEGGGTVSVKGPAAEIRDPEGRVLVRYSGGVAEISAPDGDLRLSAPNGRVVVSSGQEVSFQVGEARETPQLRIGTAAVEVDSERIDVKSQVGRLVADQASILAHRITTTATVVTQNVERLELTATQIVERARDTFRDVQDLAQTRAGRVRTLVQDLYSLYSKRTALQSTEETSVDGSKVLLG